MTDTNITDAPAITGTVEHLDPSTLNIGDNVRNEAALTKAFLANIAENGVLVPITAVRDDDGTVTVRNGQRRTLAAREAGLTSVPVYVMPHAAVDSTDETVQRVIHQIVTNDHVHGLTDAQRARGIQQMLDTGVSMTKVAAKLSVSRNIVKAARTAAASTAAMDALDNGQLSLTEAAACAEFEDTPAALDVLSRVAGTNQFSHTVERLRQERAMRQAWAIAAQDYTERGFTVLEQRPGRDDDGYTQMHMLRTADNTVIGDEPVGAAEHWAVYLREAIDYHDPNEGSSFVPVYYCTNPAAVGLTVANYYGTGTANDGEEDDETAEQKARERRKTVALNRLGNAAQIVRREFVTKMLARKTPPKGAALFVAQCLAVSPTMLTANKAQATAAELLGIDGGTHSSRWANETLTTANDARAQVVILALVLGALEAVTPKSAWRGDGGCWGGVSSADYLRFLTEQGYGLADVEDIITGDRDSWTVYDEYVAAQRGT